MYYSGGAVRRGVVDRQRAAGRSRERDGEDEGGVGAFGDLDVAHRDSDGASTLAVVERLSFRSSCVQIDLLSVQLTAAGSVIVSRSFPSS